MGAKYHSVHRFPLFFNAGTVGIAANATTYFVVLGNANFNRVQNVIPFAMTLRTFRVSSDNAPGAGEDYVYTVMVNNIATALTATIEGAVQDAAADLVNVIQVLAGDRISIRLVTSAGAAVRYHRCSLEGR